jgi:hypothetical protein
MSKQYISSQLLRIDWANAAAIIGVLRRLKAAQLRFTCLFDLQFGVQWPTNQSLDNFARRAQKHVPKKP